MSRRNLEECNLQKILCQDITILWSNAWAVALIQWKLCQYQVIHRTLDLLCALEVSGNQTRLTLACPWMRARLQVIIRHDHYVPAMQRLYSTFYGYNHSFTYVMYIHSTSAQTKSFISPVSPRFPRLLTDWWTDVQAYLGFPQYIRLLIRLGAVGARSLWREVLYRILSKTSRSPVYISSGGTINILCRKLHAKTPPCSDTVSCCLQWSHLKRQIKESSM